MEETEETGFVRLPGSLDPGAQEFIPRIPNRLILFGPLPLPIQPLPPPPHQLYYPYPQTHTEFVPYAAQYSASSAYVGTGVTEYKPIPPPSAAATRAVLLSSVPFDVSEATVRREVEGFGEVRWIQMERLCEGIVTVHFYDLRHAERALREIREQYMQYQARFSNHYAALSFMTTRPPPPPIPNNLSTHQLPVLIPLPAPTGCGLIAGQPVWAQFVIPALRAIADGHNQGTIVIFHLDPAVTTSTLRDAFQAFGPVKELRETPSKKHQRFIEFFDVRDAAKAHVEMNGKEINGKPVVIEFSRPGGHSSKYLNAISTTNPTLVSPHCTAPYHTNYPTPPELCEKISRRSGSSNVFPPRLCSSSSSQIQFISGRNKAVSNSSKRIIVSSENGNNKSRSVDSKMASLNLDRIEERDYESVAPPRRPPSSSKKICRNSQSKAVSVVIIPKQAKSGRGKKGRQAKKFDSKFLIKEDASVESSSGDTRTTVMIKNIPNKYSQKLLLNMLDNHCIHCNQQIVVEGGNGDVEQQPFSSYDFVYLPIDFNNKCNVGYGFVNMTSPAATLRLYKAFHLQHWEVFNSRKICEVTYARVQGLEALTEHFKNSKFPCEMEHYLPVVFSPPRDGRQLTNPLPIVGAQIPNNNNDGLFLPLPIPPPHHLHHDHDTDAPVSACFTDDDNYSSGRSGGLLMADDDEGSSSSPSL